MREKLGSFPIEVTKSNGIITIKFYPKKPDAKKPDNPFLILKLDDIEKEKLQKIIN
jgi:hypothetical protein